MKESTRLIRAIKKGEVRSVVDGNKRLYMNFSCVNYDGHSTNQVAAFSAGCNLNCYYCASYTKDFLSDKPLFFIPPINFKAIDEEMGFYTPEETFRKFREVADQRKVSGLGIGFAKNYDATKSVNSFTIRFCEPTIGFTHLFELAKLFEGSEYSFQIETNGIIWGRNPDMVDQLAVFKKNLEIVLTIKAGSYGVFQRMTGAKGEWLEYQFQCLRDLVKHGFKLKVLYMCGPKLGNEQEKDCIEDRIHECGFHDEKRIGQRDYVPYFVPEYCRKAHKWTSSDHEELRTVAVEDSMLNGV